jgi:drug/metabolite transporter (DMT)-like permease
MFRFTSKKRVERRPFHANVVKNQVRFLLHSKSNTMRAALWMSGAIFSFSAMAVAGRELASELDTFEIMTYRSLIGFLIVITCAGLFKTHREITTDRFGLHFTRNIAHFIGQNLWFYAVTLIPFAQLFAFEFSVPIWVMLAAPFLLGERLGALRIVAIITGFIGILIVTRPWMAGLAPGIIPAALCAIAFAATAVFTKQLTQTASITCIMFWLTALQLVFGLVCAGYDGDIALPTGTGIPWIILVGCCGLLAHFCLTTALKLAPATIVTPIDFCRLPIIAIIGYVFYNEAIDAYIIGGALVIFAANYLNIWSENKARS